jgi:hypothetical protein
MIEEKKRSIIIAGEGCLFYRFAIRYEKRHSHLLCFGGCLLCGLHKPRYTDCLSFVKTPGYNVSDFSHDDLNPIILKVNAKDLSKLDIEAVVGQDNAEVMERQGLSFFCRFKLPLLSVTSYLLYYNDDNFTDYRELTDKRLINKTVDELINSYKEKKNINRYFELLIKNRI